MRNTSRDSSRPAIITSRLRADSIPVPIGDRRRTPRYALSLAITMQGENNFYSGLSEDISESGVFIATHHLLAIGTPVVLSFTLPFSAEPLVVHGTVQWVRGPDATAKHGELFGAGAEIPGVMPGMGVKFHDISSAARREIRDFMHRRSPVFFEA